MYKGKVIIDNPSGTLIGLDGHTYAISTSRGTFNTNGYSIMGEADDAPGEVYYLNGGRFTREQIRDYYRQGIIKPLYDV